MPHRRRHARPDAGDRVPERLAGHHRRKDRARGRTAGLTANVDTVRTLVICGLVVVLAVGVGSVGKVAGADCMDRFPEGRFGISPSRPVVAKLVVPEFSPLYLA